MGNIITDRVIEHELEYCDGIFTKLVEAGGPWGYRNPKINGDNYPVVSRKGINRVWFTLIPGERFVRKDGWVYLSDVGNYLYDNGMRFPSAVEALLPPANDKQLGRRNRPMVAIIADSPVIFVVHGNDRERNLGLIQVISDDIWNPSCEFLGVCK